MSYPKIFVNKHQSKETRRWKYYNVRANGFPVNTAMIVRDWTVNHVVEFIQLMNPRRYN